MGMHYTTRRKAIVRIGKELRSRGWTLFGFTEDRSDPMTDYYAPAHWDGVATHPELGNTVIGVDVDDYTVEHHAGKNGWPEFQATPHRKTWHIERDGTVLKTGVGLSRCVSAGWEDYVSNLVDRMEYLAHKSTSALASKPKDAVDDAKPLAADESITVTIEHDRDWTWLYFSAKPPSEVREELKAMGAHWSHKRSGWYFRRDVPDEELEWLDKSNREETETKSEEHVPLILDDEGMDADPPDDAQVGQAETEEREKHAETDDDPVANPAANPANDDDISEERGNRWIEHLEALANQDAQDSQSDNTASTDAEAASAVDVPEGWTQEDVEALLEALEDGPILISDMGAGMPSIHGFDSPKHLGFGMFRVSTRDYVLEYDAGTAMITAPSGKVSWTPLRVKEGEYDYPFEDVRATLEAYLGVLEDASAAATGGAKGDIEDLAAQADTIKEREGEPCTVVVEDSAITTVITPAWLYRQWQLHKMAIREETPVDDAVYDTAARRMFRNGEMPDAAFCRFCRCAIAGAVTGMEREVWEEAYKNGNDFEPSPSCWKPFIGGKRPEPQYDIGDAVHFAWKEDTERRSVNLREWRLVDGQWHYKVSGKWWAEKSLEPADDEPVIEVQPFEAESPKRISYRARPEGTEEWAWKAWDKESIQNQVEAAVGACEFVGLSIAEPARIDVQPVIEPDGDKHYRARIEGGDCWQWTAATSGKIEQQLLDQVGGIVTLHQPALHRLEHGDNGSQVYFEGARYLILNPYVEREESVTTAGTKETVTTRRATGWVVYQRDDRENEWLCVPDPNGDNPALSCIGDFGLHGAVQKAEEALDVAFELVGAPDDLPNSYPLPEWMASHQPEVYLFQEGDRVWWENAGQTLSGTVQYAVHPGDEEASINCDQQGVAAGGGQVEHVPIVRLHPGEPPTFPFDIGDRVWWDGPQGTLVGEVVDVIYLGRPHVQIKVPSGIITDNSVTVERTHGYTLSDVERLRIQKGEPPEPVTILEAGDTVVVADDVTIAGSNVLSPAGNRCRADRHVEAGDEFEIVEFFKSSSIATRGDVCVAAENDGYEFHIPVRRLALDGESVSEVDNEASKLDNEASKLDNEASKLDNEASKLDNEADDNETTDDGNVSAGDVIEVDRGRRYGWTSATVRRVSEHYDKLYYVFEGGGKGSQPLYGRGITWRIP